MSERRDHDFHHYFGVNYDIVWTILKNELPDVLVRIEAALKLEKGPG